MNGTARIPRNGAILVNNQAASIDEQGQSVHIGDFRAQCWRTYRNITRLLESEGASWHDVVRTSCYLRDIDRDYDALMFGSPLLVKNLSITGRRKVPRQDRFIIVEPEQIGLKETLDSLGIDRGGLIFLGILLGTDFNEGVKGVGPKTALKIVKEHKTHEAIIAYVKKKYDYDFEVDVEEVFNLFLSPPYEPPKEGELRWKPPDREGVLKMLVEQHDFSADRVEKSLDDLLKITKERSAQSKLEQWF